ncbi:type II secretion system F family protein [Peptoniphilus sp.]|jgi:type IV pilus assembly protein PilC|uniref:type II secretion system F family protein n=1 Tax=Peptoniphilus sp. TaxID=1971214 RepID=UPI003D8E071E
MLFEYRAISGDEILNGNIESESLDDAIKALKSKGLKPIKVSENISINNKIKVNKVFKDHELQILFNELYILLSSGISIEKSFDILAEQFSKKKHSSLNEISDNLKNGKSLYQAMDATKNFPKFVISLIYVGESTSNLLIVFKNLSKYYKKNSDIKSKILNALAYPIILLITTFVVVNFLISNVIPGFNDIFESAGSSLPLITRIIMNVSEFMQRYNLLILVAILLVLLYIIYLKNSRPKKLHAFYLKSKFYRSVKTLNFSFKMEVCLTSGMTLDRSLNIISDMEENVALKEKYASIITSIKSGNSLWESLECIGIFPEIFISLVRVGEESSSLRESFKTCTEFYEDDLDSDSKKFLNVLGPVLIIILSFIVGFIVLGIALPIFDMVNQF